MHGGEAFGEAMVVRHPLIDTRLLENDLGEQDVVGGDILSPRQGTCVLVVPASESKTHVIQVKPLSRWGGMGLLHRAQR